MKIKIAILCYAGAVMFLTACCAQSRLAADYGTSFELQKHNQILKAEAEKNLDPVTGMNAKAAQSSVDVYQKSFEKKENCSTAYQINIGAMGK